MSTRFMIRCVPGYYDVNRVISSYMALTHPDVSSFSFRLDNTTKSADLEDTYIISTPDGQYIDTVILFTHVLSDDTEIYWRDRNFSSI